MLSYFFHRLGPSLLSIILLLCVIGLSVVFNRTAIPVQGAERVVSSLEEPQELIEKEEPLVSSEKEEMRAVWVPYMSLDMSQTDGSYLTFQKKFDEIIALAKEKGMNALIVHVRPFSDALYPSDYFPWSHILTGSQGIHPGYDPLAYMVEATHEAGVEFHAWVNPLRIQTKETPAQLSPQNFGLKWQAIPEKLDYVLKYQGGLYYNPAYPEVRTLIADGVGEIVEKYDVDGVQFDDYFYPTQDSSFDQIAYQSYVEQTQPDGTALSQEEWRMANINAMVSQVYAKIKSINPEVVFGISPQGNISNDKKMGADVESWCSVPGYIDYICPQLYVNFENPVLPYDDAVQQWTELVTSPSVKLYFGLAVYKAGSEVDDGTWKKSSNILSRQIEEGRKAGGHGFMFYSWEYLDKEQTKEEIQNVMKILD